jgi:hypothetical protein
MKKIYFSFCAIADKIKNIPAALIVLIPIFIINIVDLTLAANLCRREFIIL